MHGPYVRSFEGFGRPWSHLEQLIEDVHVRQVTFGTGYIMTGDGGHERLPADGQIAARWRT
jgi:hypothetical protein